MEILAVLSRYVSELVAACYLGTERWRMEGWRMSDRLYSTTAMSNVYNGMNETIFMYISTCWGTCLAAALIAGQVTT